MDKNSNILVSGFNLNKGKMAFLSEFKRHVFAGGIICWFYQG